ncbi:MAG: AAA family ATPase [Chlorobi bacterium]|nr:AAA family ATPase [Chlorobiota bacterium]
MSIKRIFISGFKSIESIELTDVSDFTAFAGANGAGKSNFFDALCFVSMIIKIGAVDAIRKYGGYSQIHCLKKRGTGARTFRFSIEIEIEKKLWEYNLELKKMDSDPTITEKLITDGIEIFSRKAGAFPQFKQKDKEKELLDFPKSRSSLMFAFSLPIYLWLTNINVYRIDPLGAKIPDSAFTDNTELDKNGHNVATILASLEKDNEFRETIMEWMEIIVPGLKKVSTENMRLDGRTALTFSETGTKAKFPANLISDGTVYTLCILTAVLSRSSRLGLTLIEEPERGINPKAVAQIVELMRDNSNVSNPIWVTTHNETLVRSSKPEELIVVDKIDGKTQFKYGRDSADVVGDMPLDKAWLSNFLGGGLPW